MKKYIFTFFVSTLVLFCILFPESMITSAKNGISLWWKIILPSLFPFLILSNLIIKTALPKLFGKLLNPVMQFIFKLPGISALAVFLGMLGGYPVGAKITADLRETKVISLNTANKLIAFTNNAGPLFITGAIGVGLYNNKKIGLLLLLTHYISASLVGIIFKIPKEEGVKNSNIEFEIITLSKLGNTLNEAIKNAISSVVAIGGFIVLFSIISTILIESGIISFISGLLLPKLDKNVSYSIFSGLLEVTNGVNLLSTSNIPLNQKLILTSILLGFGGFSIHAQTLSVIAKTDIKIIFYLLGKTFQGIIAGILTYLALLYTNFSEILLTPTFAGIEYNSYGFNAILSVILWELVSIVIFKIFQTLWYNVPSKNHTYLHSSLSRKTQCEIKTD